MPDASTRRLLTHHFPLEGIMEAYETFGDAARQKALKVVIAAPVGAGA